MYVNTTDKYKITRKHQQPTATNNSVNSHDMTITVHHYYST